MALVFAAVMPHGDALIPGVGEPANASRKLTEAARRVAVSATHAKLDALILASPHGVRVSEAHSVSVGVRAGGSLGPYSLEAHVDRRLARSIIHDAKARDIPVTGVLFGGENVPLPIDWGTFVPLWFLSEAGLNLPVVVVCPSRDLTFESLGELGEVIAEVAERGLRRIGFIASADQAHAHDRKGPYGYHAAAQKFDRMVTRILREGAYRRLLRLDPNLIEKALPDSPWQLAILAGALSKVAFTPNGVVYDRPSYFGMICADFHRVKPPRRKPRR